MCLILSIPAPGNLLFIKSMWLPHIQDGDSPLIKACETGKQNHLECARLLLEAGANATKAGKVSRFLVKNPKCLLACLHIATGGQLFGCIFGRLLSSNVLLMGLRKQVDE
jgi:hypothetical protein